MEEITENNQEYYNSLTSNQDLAAPIHINSIYSDKDFPLVQVNSLNDEQTYEEQFIILKNARDNFLQRQNQRYQQKNQRTESLPIKTQVITKIKNKELVPYYYNLD